MVPILLGNGGCGREAGHAWKTHFRPLFPQPVVKKAESGCPLAEQLLSVSVYYAWVGCWENDHLEL